MIVDRDSGHPIAGATVEALDENGAPVFAQTRSMRDGVYVLPLRNQEKALLVVTAAGNYPAFHALVDPSREDRVAIVALSKVSADESAWLRRINHDRAARRLGALVMDESALLAAREHAADMAQYGYFRHTDRSGKAPWQRYFGFFGIGQDYENIAVAQGVGWSQIESSFLAEGPRNGMATHYSNLFNPKALWAGVAIAHGAPHWMASGAADYFDQELIAYP